MHTTITKSLKGVIMEHIFEHQKETVYVKHYKGKLEDGEKYDPENVYKFEITVRHNEDEDPKQQIKNAEAFAILQQKREYNRLHEQTYYYAPFTEQRMTIRADWNKNPSIDWDIFLYDTEQKHKSNINTK